MTAQIFKVILAGILGGVAIFLMPFFLVRAVVFFLLIGIIIRLLRPRGWRREFGFCHSSRYSQRWNNMTPEQRHAFKEKMEKEFFAADSPASTTP